MAHFRAFIRGGKGPGASRLGTAKSGLWVDANGWNGGVHVGLHVHNGQDWATISLTPGSGSAGSRVIVYDGPLDLDARAKLAADLLATA